MSVDLYLEGLRSKDNDNYQKMLKIKHACEEAEVDLPKKVKDYFDGGDDESPLVVELKAEEWNDEYRSGLVAQETGIAIRSYYSKLMLNDEESWKQFKYS